MTDDLETTLRGLIDLGKTHPKLSSVINEQVAALAQAILAYRGRIEFLADIANPTEDIDKELLKKLGGGETAKPAPPGVIETIRIQNEIRKSCEP